jgi:hypothetical protein
MFNSLIKYSFWTIVIRIICEKFYILTSSYLAFRSVYDKIYVSHLSCISDEIAHKSFEYLCAEAAIRVEQWPVIEAFGKLVNETPSCIQFSCGDLIYSMTNSWASFIFSTCIGLILAIYIMTQLSRVFDYFTKLMYYSVSNMYANTQNKQVQKEADCGQFAVNMPYSFTKKKDM